MGVSERRSAVRSAGYAARRGLVGVDRNRAESGIAAHLGSLQLGGASGSGGCSGGATTGLSIGVFVADDGEPDLSSTFAALRVAGHQLALPVLNDAATDFSMRFWPWFELDELVPGRYGIPVPPRRDPVEPAVLFVPLVGFDSEANRMGRGAGFYDRYLATSAAYTVGVAFEVQHFEDVETQPHDVALDAIVTDLGVRFMPGRRRENPLTGV